MITTLQYEITARIFAGAQQLTMSQFQAQFATLGYQFDRRCDCASIARYIMGDRIGATYPALSLYPVQISDNLSAWNISARRDDNFRAMQTLRNKIFAVSHGRIVEV